jgi:hypothetical protein
MDPCAAVCRPAPSPRQRRPAPTRAPGGPTVSNASAPTDPRRWGRAPRPRFAGGTSATWHAPEVGQQPEGMPRGFSGRRGRGGEPPRRPSRAAPSSRSTPRGPPPTPRPRQRPPPLPRGRPAPPARPQLPLAPNLPPTRPRRRGAPPRPRRGRAAGRLSTRRPPAHRSPRAGTPVPRRPPRPPRPARRAPRAPRAQAGGGGVHPRPRGAGRPGVTGQVSGGQRVRALFPDVYPSGRLRDAAPHNLGSAHPRSARGAGPVGPAGLGAGRAARGRLFGAMDTIPVSRAVRAASRVFGPARHW